MFYKLLRFTSYRKNKKADYIIKNEKIELIYQPGKGVWTYHLRIPNSKDIDGKWGDIKVLGSIDDFKIEAQNLAPIKGEDKMLSINGKIRKAINKEGGDIVTVSLCKSLSFFRTTQVSS